MKRVTFLLNPYCDVGDMKTSRIIWTASCDDGLECKNKQRFTILFIRDATRSIFVTFATYHTFSVLVNHLDSSYEMVENHWYRLLHFYKCKKEN
jgi:hypothetical protein